jgi:hypothetical protein
MYGYLVQHGSPALVPCGPCQRTGTLCIRHPTWRKCAICFRGHDVCGIWDDTVVSIGRRRVSSKHAKIKKV